MPKFRVSGSIKCWIDCVVEVSQEELDRIKADGGSEDEYIIEKAYDEFSGVSGYAGNGGTDKLIGVSGSDESIFPADDFEFDEVEAIS